MDARKATAATVFLVALSLSFGYLRVQATANSCSRVVYPATVTADTQTHRIVCFSSSAWSIGSDPCNTSGFAPYEGCRPDNSLCDVPSEDFLVRGPTFICCEEHCFEFKIEPVVSHIDVPPVIQAGKEVTVYTTFTAKPLPPDIPSLIVNIWKENEPNVSTISVETLVVPSPSNDTEYIILHTFMVPLDDDERSSWVRPELVLPNENWRILVERTFEPIVVVFPVAVQPPTTTDAGGTPTTTDSLIAPTITPTTTAANVGTTSTATALDSTATVRPKTTNVMDTRTTTAMTAGDTSTMPGPTTGGVSLSSTCVGAGYVAAAAVGGMMAAIIVFVIFVCVFIWYKRGKRYSKSKETPTPDLIEMKNPPQPTDRITPRPNNMHLPAKIPRTIVTQHSTPTPGYGETPSEAKPLLTPLSRNHGAASAAASSPAPITGAANPGYHSSPTTPYSPGDQVHPLLARSSSSEPSAASAASTAGDRVEAPAGVSSDSGSSSEQGIRGQDETDTSNQQESSSHIYDELRPRPRRDLGPLPKIPEQNTYPVSYNNMHQSHKEPHLLIKPKTIEVSVNQEDMVRALLQLQNQNNLLRSHPHPTADVPLEDDSIPVYDRSKDGEVMILPLQPELSTKV